MSRCWYYGCLHVPGCIYSRVLSLPKRWIQNRWEDGLFKEIVHTNECRQPHGKTPLNQSVAAPLSYMELCPEWIYKHHGAWGGVGVQCGWWNLEGFTESPPGAEVTYAHMREEAQCILGRWKCQIIVEVGEGLNSTETTGSLSAPCLSLTLSHPYPEYSLVCEKLIHCIYASLSKSSWKMTLKDKFILLSKSLNIMKFFCIIPFYEHLFYFF